MFSKFLHFLAARYETERTKDDFYSPFIVSPEVWEMMANAKTTTVSGCSLREEDVIETVTLSIDEALCQDLCFQSTNCAVFHHTKDNCTLLTEDYRQDCQNAGGLPVFN